jgi:L,D-transpeptidase catalytic domain
VSLKLKRPPEFGARLGKGALALGLMVTTGVGLMAATHMLSHGNSSKNAGSGLSAPLPPALPMVSSAPAPGSRAGNLPEVQATTPEGRLIQVYRAIADNRMVQALDLAQALATEMPKFRLAQLVYADLLSTRRGDLAAFGGELNRVGGDVGMEVVGLREEAMMRLAALRERPPANAVPTQFVVLPPDVKHAIAVDVSRARLYLFENGPQGIRLVADHYVSIGKQGAAKLVEGDQKTPLGTYFISDVIDPTTLEDRFGSGALPLNYPSGYDRVSGRTGSGILLHGVPSKTYSRPPRDTDGCVVLANEDLKRLAATIVPRGTPVVLAQRLDWVAANRAQEGSQDFLAALHQWQQARVADDLATLATYYGAASDAPSTTPAPAPRGSRVRKVAAFDELSVLGWDNRRQVMVVSFRERGPQGQRARRLTRQYWAREAGHWKILSQDPSA